MTWWKRSLYDTCSLITLDKLLLERPTMARHFPKSILALEKSFSADQLREQTAKRMRRKVTIQELPAAHDLATVFSSADLSPALADVDKLIYASAVHFRLSVVTADRRLGREVRDAGLQVTDFASILRDLVQAKRISASGCERLLEGLAQRNDLLLGTPAPTWADLEAHSFPDRRPTPRKK
jgi:hypothetical protein